MKKIFGALLILVSFLGCSLGGNTPPASDLDPDPIIKTFRISIVNSSRGTVQTTPNKDTYYEGDVVTLEAVPNTNYLFNKWSINDEDLHNNPISFVLSKNLVVYPQFSLIPEYCLEVKYNKYIGGVTSPTSEVPGLYYGGIYKQNTTIQLRVTAINESGYSFSHWEVNGTEFNENPINIYLYSDTIVRPRFIDTKEVIDPNDFITVTDSLSGSYVGSGYCYRSLIYKLVNASDFSITVLESAIYYKYGTGYAKVTQSVNSGLNAGNYLERKIGFNCSEVNDYCNGYIEWKCSFDGKIFFVSSR